MPGPRIPYVDLARQNEEIRAELLAAAAAVIDHSQFIQGPEVEAFEEEFSEICGTRYAIGLNSGLDALVLALKALDIGIGDEVITVPNSYIATAAAIGIVGAKPVFVDVRDDYNMDPALLNAAITENTKAILPVHLTGRPAPMDDICSIAADRGIAVIEDAAQAITAEYRGRRVGGIGNIGCFSLHPLKTLGACGDAGVITTNDSDTDARIRRLRNHGLVDRDRCLEWGHNSRLDSLQAAILLAKLGHIDTWTERRRANAQIYRSKLYGLPDLTIPEEPDHLRHVYHTFMVQTDRRDDLARALDEAGIGTAIHYPIPIHLQPAAAYLGYGTGDFPVAERQAGRILSIPVHHGLSEIETIRISDTIARICSAR